MKIKIRGSYYTIQKNAVITAAIVLVGLICTMFMLYGSAAKEEKALKQFSEGLIQAFNTDNVMHGETVVAMRKNTPLPAWRHRYSIMSGQYMLFPSEDEEGIYDLYTTFTTYETIDATSHRGDAQFMKGYKKADTCTAVTSILYKDGVCTVVRPTFIKSEAEQKWTQQDLFQTGVTAGAKMPA